MNNNLPGIYIVLEGIVGSGKSVQLPRILEFLKQTYPDQEMIFTREPGGTLKAEEIREKVIHIRLNPLEEVRLFAEARESTLKEVVRPALKRGAIVVSDRSVFSSLSYQTKGRGLEIEYVWWRNEEIVGDTLPDYILYLDVDFETCIKRSAKDNPDKFDSEGVGFWRRVKEGYEDGFEFIKKLGAGTQILRIEDREGALSIEDISEQIRSKIKPFIDGWLALKEGHVVGERQR